MKKLMALALTLAMVAAMGSTMFAAPTPSVDSTTNPFDTSNQASTDVDVLVDTSNISATVPIKLSIAAMPAGGDCLNPTDGAYKIINNCGFALKVTSITATNGSQTVKLTDTPYIQTSANSSGTALPAAGIDDNKVAMYLNNDQIKTTAITPTPASFSIPAKTSASEAALAMNVRASNTVLTVSTTQSAAFTMQFTISA